MKPLTSTPNLTSILLALLLVLALANVLVTPNPTDDVRGVVHAHRTLTASFVVLALGLSLAVILTMHSNDSTHLVVSSLNLLELLCTCRC